ncbi:uncharacterized protein LOC113781254 [Coffea eugenioides]|uniref:Uncharacterized protein isoform X2 n=1 Tax=Coffea arabica TaxID=13443 RepID=A0A6P6TPY8_COFAR|nr:uncharacterized protein LOC113703115 [Coffea arabica]XP_027156102.1 uncharacterized protein LOC113756762 [Coffea eugenioides]XP_027182961.1 uncharacterized protein LOC113781254 [Coffea eugenioides]
MASSSRKRPKTQNPHSSSSSPSSFSQYSIPEPSSGFFPSSISEFSRLIAVVTIAASVALFCNYLVTYFNQQPKPFCDSGVDVGDFLSGVDNCEPCPSNGICKDGNLECERGYRKQGNLCIEDRDINAAAMKISELVEVRLCEAYAQYLCSGIGTIWVQKDDLSTYIVEHRVMEDYGLDQYAYAHAKLRAMETIHKLMDRRGYTSGSDEFKCPDSLVEHYKPITCRIHQWVLDHALLLVPVCAVLVGSILILLKALRRHYLLTRAEEIYNKVCDLLEENTLISRSIDGEGEPWVVASWLRDYLLSPRERKDPLLWRKVEELVQDDSRLDRYPKMVKGEAKIVWEWQVEGSLSSSGKRKKTEESTQRSSRLKNSTSNEQSFRFKAGEPLNC